MITDWASALQGVPRQGSGAGIRPHDGPQAALRGRQRVSFFINAHSFVHLLVFISLCSGTRGRRGSLRGTSSSSRAPSPSSASRPTTDSPRSRPPRSPCSVRGEVEGCRWVQWVSGRVLVEEVAGDHEGLVTTAAPATAALIHNAVQGSR